MAESMTNGHTTKEAKQAADNAASKMAEAGRDAMNQASQKAKDMYCAVEDTVDRTLSSVGAKACSAAETIRSSSPSFAARPAEAVAGAIETGGEYLREKGVADIASDATTIVKRYPLESLMIGFGAGLLLGRSLTRRS